jgi:hypothetical protein
MRALFILFIFAALLLGSFECFQHHQQQQQPRLPSQPRMHRLHMLLQEQRGARASGSTRQDRVGVANNVLHSASSSSNVEASSASTGVQSIGGYSQSIGTLLALTALWSISDRLPRLLYPLPPAVLYAGSSTVSACMLGFLHLRSSTPMPDNTHLRAGLELASWFMAGSTLQILGLWMGVHASTIDAVGQLGLVLIPIGETLILKQNVRKTLWAAVFLSVMGSIILGTIRKGASGRFALGAGLLSTSGVLAVVGAASTLVAPIFYAGYELRLTALGKRCDPVALATSQQFFQALGSCTGLLAFTLFLGLSPRAGPPGGRLIFGGCLACLLGGSVLSVTSVARCFAQPVVGATRSNCLYSLQPLWQPWDLTGGFSRRAASTMLLLGAWLAALPRGWRGLEVAMQEAVAFVNATYVGAKENFDKRRKAQGEDFNL